MAGALRPLRARGQLAHREGRARRVGEHRFAERPCILGAGEDRAAELGGARGGCVGVDDPEVGPPMSLLILTGTSHTATTSRATGCSGTPPR